MSEITKELKQALLTEYWMSLPIPVEPWRGPQFLLSVVGPIGSGKSTLLAQFSEALGLLQISSDGMRNVLTRHGCDYEHLKPLMRITYEHFLDAGYSIAMDMNCGNPETKENIKEIEQRYQIKSHWLTIDLPAAVIQERLQAGRSDVHDSFESAWRNYLAQQKLDHFTPLHQPFLTVTENITSGEIEILISGFKTSLPR